MIDWASVVFSILWLLGAAVILAALSSAYYEAQRQGERLRVRLAAPGFQVRLSVGLILISLGLALIGPRWWERFLWGLLCAASVWQLWAGLCEWKAESDDRSFSKVFLGRVQPDPPQAKIKAELPTSRLRSEQASIGHEKEPIPWRSVFPPLVLLIAVLLFYVATLAPTVLWGDDAYFQRTAFEGTLRADGGGHWLWLQAARLFIRLPWGDVAYRVNLLSAVAAAFGAALVCAGGRALGLTPVGATMASVSLAVSHTFWNHAVRAEVYTLYMFLMALQLWLWLSWRPERAWPILAAALLFGTVLLGHQMALLLLPALGFLLWQRKRWLSARQWLLLLLFFAVGLFPFFAVVKQQMADIGFLAGLRLYFTRSGEDYSHAMFDLSLSSLPRDAVIWVGFLGLQFVGLAGVLGLWGWVDLWRKDRDTSWLALAIVYATGVLFAFSYHVSDQYVFYLPSYLAFAFFVGRGWQAASEAWPWAAANASKLLVVALLVVVPIATYDVTSRLLAGMKANPMDIRQLPGREPNRFFLWPAKNGYFGAADYGRSVLDTLHPNSVLLADYTPMETIRYFRSVEGLRPDVRLKYVAPGRDLAPVVTRFPSDTVIYLADNNPDYYDIGSLTEATLRQDGLVYELLLER